MTFGEKYMPRDFKTQSFRSYLRELGYEDIDMIIDARFRHADRDGGYCAGFHPNIQRALLAHKGFDAWLRDVKLEFLTKLDRQRDQRGALRPFVLAIFCHAGKHRSVAAACILNYILCRQGYLVEDIIHIEEASWGRYCCGGTCEACTAVPAWLEEDLSNANNIWTG